MSTMDEKQHWETVYGTRAPESVSWFQPEAVRSVTLIESVTEDRAAPIIDVGGGASVLVDDLLRRGFLDVSVLDLSGTALERTRTRLGERSGSVTMIEGDIRTAPLPAHHYALWHDRAVFHFLTEAADRAAYVRQLTRSLRPRAHAIIATFAEDGPLRCSGLPVARYSADALHRELGAGFTLVASQRELHATPMGTSQAFVYCLFRRDAAGAGSDAR